MTKKELHLIDKSALVAEIERRLKVHMESNHGFSARYDELKDILSFLDTLETKEADLEKELIQNGIIINGVVYEFMPVDPKSNQHGCEDCDLIEQCSSIDSDVLCDVLFGTKLSRAKHFKRVDV